MTSVIIPYKSNIDGLAVVLTLLELQTTRPRQIIVIDNSANHEGERISSQYVYRNRLNVLPAQSTIYKSWNAAIRACTSDVLIINDDIIMPIDTVEQFETAAKTNTALCYVPVVPSINNIHHRKIPDTFRYSQNSFRNPQPTRWMSGFCFYLPRSTLRRIGLFDPAYSVWYGDFDYQKRLEQSGFRKVPVARIPSLSIYHFGTLSYKVDVPAVRKQISKDEHMFNAKYGPSAASIMVRSVTMSHASESSPDIIKMLQSGLHFFRVPKNIP